MTDCGNSLDSSGANTLIYDYQNSVNPNVVAFTLSVTNFYVSQTNAPMQVTVTSGWPGVYAVLVNNTNLADAVWQSYTSPNITAALGSTNGVYTVLVGLSGSASNPQKAWQSVTFEKDASSLVLMMTNLSSLSGARPFIDPAGYASRALRSISYTVTNAGGGIYSGSGQAVAPGINPGDPMHTTNLFSCVDLALTLGTNLVSIAASDWTGATAVTNFAYVFSTNGVTNVPALTLDWPTNETYVAGTNFTVEAGVDDDTAALTLQYTDTNAILQTIAGEVERGGNVWFECVPLPAGTNSYSIIACNAAGNMSTNTFNVIKATSMTLEIEPLDTNQLDSGYVTVAGSVSDTTCAISVNGVAGVNDGEGDWYVENVPLPPGGTVMMEVVATPGSGPPVQCALEQDRPPVVYTQSFSYQLDYTWYYVFDDVTEYSVTEDCWMQWERGVGGTNVEVNLTTNFPGGALADGSSVLQLVWPADNGYLPILGAEAATSNYESGTWTAADSYSNTAPPLVETFEESDSSGAMPGYWDASWTETSSRQVRLFTGGKALRQEQALFDLSATLTNETQVLTNDSYWGPGWEGLFDDYIYDDTVEYAALPFLQPASTPTYVTPQDISLGALGAQASDTNLWTLQPNATVVDITPQNSGSYGQFTPAPHDIGSPGGSAQMPWRSYTGPFATLNRYRLIHHTEVAAYGDKNRSRKNLGVGEYVDLSGMPTNTVWTTTGGSVSPTNGATSTFIAPSNAVSSVTLTGTAGWLSLKVGFQVFEPIGVVHSILTSVDTDVFDEGDVGVGIWTVPYFGPLNVSFYWLYGYEEGENATSVSGYYANTNYYTASQLSHTIHGANDPIPIMENNAWYWSDDPDDGSWDHAAWYETNNPGVDGSFTWVIPQQWKAGTNGVTNTIGTNTLWNQTFTLAPNGDMTVSKFGWTITRGTNGQYRTNSIGP